MSVSGAATAGTNMEMLAVACGKRAQDQNGAVVMSLLQGAVSSAARSAQTSPQPAPSGNLGVHVDTTA